MLTVRPAAARGSFDHGWLKTAHTFSFAGYRDPRHMGFRSLRVMNEDRVSPGMGFGAHGHRDMEIVTYVLEGELAHADSLGHEATLRPGEFQRITAGTGLQHSEFNPSAAAPVHFYQIWLTPEREGLEPGYEQKAFDPAGRAGQWQLVASPDGRDGSLSIRQDASIWLADLPDGRALRREFSPGRAGWLQVLRGHATANGTALGAGDGLAVEGEGVELVGAGSGAEVMLFDLA